jgi:hypothetical protein
MAMDILTSGLSLLGVYSLFIYLPFLLPCNLIPSVASTLNETQQLLVHAEDIGAIRDVSEYRTSLAMYEGVVLMPTDRHVADRHSSANQFLEARTDSQRSPRIFQQLLLAARHGMTYKLYALSSRIEAVKVQLEVGWNTFVIYPMSNRHLSWLWTNNDLRRSPPYRAPHQYSCRTP